MRPVPPSALAPPDPPWFMPFVWTAVVAGAGLRALAAMNDFWVDEIWSLELGMAATTWASVFWGVAQDNNHPLNTLWMRLIGPEGPPLLHRLPAIACGSATVYVAARLARRHAGPTAGIAAAVLFATGLLFVNYGSEARGYGAMIFGLLVAMDGVDEWVRGARNRWTSAKICAGLAVASLSHLLAVPAAAILGAVASAALWMKAGAASLALPAIIRLGLCFTAGVAPALGAFVAGVAVTGSFTRHSHEPYTLQGHLEGLGLNLQLFVVPLWLPLAWALAVGAALALGALAVIRPGLRAAYAGGLLATASIAAAAQAPDPHYPRFHIPFSIAFALLIALGVGAAWTRGGVARATAVLLFSAVIFLNLMESLLLAERGRGQPRAAIAIMTQDGPATYFDAIEGSAPRRLRYYIEQDSKPLTRVAMSTFCRAPPDWLLDSQTPQDVTQERRFGPPGCEADFELVKYLWTGRVSGHPFSLYRRTQPAVAPMAAPEEPRPTPP